MFTNYLKIATRSLLRQKSYALINIVGLALGLTCTLLIALYIADDLSFDRFHSKHDRIYRFTQAKNDTQTPSNTAPAWADAFKTDIPQIEAAVRIYEGSEETLMGTNETKVYEKGVKFADANIFDVFDFPFLQGNPRTALLEPNTIVLTESAAKRYFGTDNPMGKIIRYDNKLDFKVTGIIRDIPQHSHLRFTMLGSMETVKRDLSLPDGFKSFFWNPFFTYILLKEGSTKEEVIPLLWRIKAKYMNDIPVVPDLQALNDIHLIHEKALSTIQFLSLIALIILLLACINYTNLATARFSGRAREVGVRKVLGATRLAVAGQFWSESLVLTASALVIALFATELSLPAFFTLTGKKLSLLTVSPIMLISGILLALLIVSLLAGLYPALFLSSFKPIQALRGKLLKSGSTKVSLRSILVVMQFSLSIAMIVGTIIVQEQLIFIQHKNLGFDREQVILVKMRGEEDYKLRETITKALSNVGGVKGISLSSSVPGKNDILIRMPIEFKYLPEGDKDPNIKWLCIDEGFLPLYGITIKEGRNLNGSENDEKEAFLLNEAAVRKLQWEGKAIGHEIGYSVGEKASNWWIEKHGRVVGVVKDFHVGTLRKEIEPLLLHVKKDFSATISIKLPKGNPHNTLIALEKSWKQIVPSRPFEYTFLDDDFQAVYNREMRIRSIVAVFSVLAIAISCLGLLGLAAFAVETRTKEIGIRKVLGASVLNVVLLLSKDFLRLVGVAFLLACPLAYLVMNKWLQDFAYRITIGVEAFVLAGFMALLAALAAIFRQTLKAARANPVTALRSE